MKIAGKILKIYQEKVYSPTFKKVIVLLHTHESHPQKILVEFQNKKADLFKWKFFVNSTIEVEIQIRGKEKPDGTVYNYVVGKEVEFKDMEQVSFMQKFKQLLSLGYKINFRKSNIDEYEVSLDESTINIKEYELNEISLTDALKSLERINDLQS